MQRTACYANNRQVLMFQMRTQHYLDLSTTITISSQGIGVRKICKCGYVGYYCSAV